MTFSNPFCEWSGRKDEEERIAELPVRTEAWARELVDDAFDVVRGLCTLLLNVLLRGDVPTPFSSPTVAKLTLDPDDVFLLRMVPAPEDVGGGLMLSSSRSSPSSHLRLDRVATELEEILRDLHRDEVTPRSSFAVETECRDSACCSSADVNASRTGKGVRFRT